VAARARKANGGKEKDLRQDQGLVLDKQLPILGYTCCSICSNHYSSDPFGCRPDKLDSTRNWLAMSEDEEVQGIEEIVAEVVNEVDLKDSIAGLRDVARMAGAYYAALVENGMPAKLVHDMMLSWQDMTLGGGDDCEHA
jgi:hypothetical protein